MHMHTYIYIYIYTYTFVVNFDALAQASDIQIERRQVVFLCWMQDLNPGSQTPNRQQTECLQTNRLSYRGSSWKLELDSPSLWSASIQPTWPHCQLTFAPGSGDIHIYTHTHTHTFNSCRQKRLTWCVLQEALKVGNIITIQYSVWPLLQLLKLLIICLTTKVPG